MTSIIRKIVCFLSILAAHSFHIIPTYPILHLPIGNAASHRQGTILRSNSQHHDASEFDFLLREGDATELLTTRTVEQQTQHRSARRRMVQLPSSSLRKHQVVLASSSAFPGAIAAPEETVDEEADPYSSALDSQLGKIEQYQERQSGSALENKLKSMDLQDIIATLFIPGVLAFVASRWVLQRVSGRVKQSAEETLDNFANEMIYHDGDFKEMELCIKDYQKKLLWMGPIKTDAMIKRYLELYSKKKTVSPQAIASLSFVLTVFQFSEAKAAAIFVQLCQQMGTQKISSIGKLLFLGSRIFKSEAGIKALLPIKTLIMSTYRDERVAESLVETSQQAIAEAAYRTAVLAAGKNQQSLAPGWEILGLSYEAATRIWEAEAKENFTSDRETMYGGQTRKYDRQGRQLTEDGKLANPEEATKEDDASSSGPTSNVYECGNCGFTLFVATGRESKFFGDNFKCPECGAAKSEFKARTDDDDE